MTSTGTHEPAPVYDRDEEHLKLLGIAHYVMAAFELLGCGAGAVYVAMAFFVPAAIEQSSDPNVPGAIGIRPIKPNVAMNRIMCLSASRSPSPLCLPRAP